ncbi:hypothetical protein BV22DRAFT_120589 [Leucogyrophana mollusca]|uniref:Uncharacterized protein n=1 Tax=Leucogyrophana mollusca TaxID=85980 RepID=A0ACB8BVX0_9AGAM|nr:hypothetical protein BV22DRAFT_120589 [Leucogyrophana mollusca]
MADDAPVHRLPIEIVHYIISFLSMRDIVRLRQVSKTFCELSHDRDIWSHAYRTAESVRPPGPFPRQTSEVLESLLVTNAKVERNLFAPKPVCSKRRIDIYPEDRLPHLILGRWLLFTNLQLASVRCYDLDTSNFANHAVIHSFRGELRYLSCVSCTGIEGRPLAFAVALIYYYPSEEYFIEIFRIETDTESTPPAFRQVLTIGCHKPVIHQVAIGPRLLVVLGHDESENIYSQTWVMDTQTNQQYHLPPLLYKKLADSFNTQEMTLQWSIPCSTHLLLSVSAFANRSGWQSYIEAFDIPPVSDALIATEPATLRKSHEGHLSDIDLRCSTLLSDSKVDSSTGELLIALSGLEYRSDHPRVPLGTMGFVVLSPPRGESTGAIAFRKLGRLSTGDYFVHFQPCLNGMGRAFYLHGPLRDRIAVLHFNIKRETVIAFRNLVSLSSRAPMPVIAASDGYKGRVCCMTRRKGLDLQRYVEVFDLA